MKMTLFALLILALNLPLPAATYYVDDAAGLDDADGRSPATAWKTLGKVNGPGLLPGDTVRFKRGGLWRGQLFPTSGAAGAPVTYAAYGSGPLPALLGSADASDPALWAQAGPNLWRSNVASAWDIGSLYLGSGPQLGVKRWARADLAAEGDFYYDRSTQFVDISCTANPALRYGPLEAALTRDLVVITGRSHVVLEDLALKYGGANGVNGHSSAWFTLRRLDISYMGGGDLNMDGSNIRYGNAIQFWQGAHDHVVEQCRMWQVYDTAVSNQGHSGPNSDAINIIYRNNLIWDMGYAAVELWNYSSGSSKIENVQFIHNTCINSGGGWGGEQRPDLKGMDVYLGAVTNPPVGVQIRNNIFEGGNAGLWVYSAAPGGWNKDTLHLDHNVYHPSILQAVYHEAGLTFTAAQLPAYQAFSQLDAHSIVAAPLLTDPAALPPDLRLLAASPARALGPKLADAPTDFYGTARPAGPVDAGAIQGPAPAGPAYTLPLGGEGAVAVPNPVPNGKEVCFYFDPPAQRALGRFYTLSGDLVATRRSEPSAQLCWPTQGLAPGVYAASLEWTGSDGELRKARRKVAILR